jgi:tetratricopeptide (TPR) repeat protein
MKKILLYNLLFSLLLSTGLSVQAQQVNIKLKINEGDEATVFRDECVLLDVAVFNKKAQSDRLWNMTGEERMDELNELLKLGKIKQEESRRKTTATELGSATASWTSAISWKVMNTANRNYIELPVILMKKPSTEGKAVLDANGYYIACYGIAPGDLKSVPPGTYAVECIINNIPSNAVLLKIQNGMMNNAVAASEPVLLRFGQYYWHNENGEKAIHYADMILEKNPSSLDALSLKGDGQVQQKLYQPALETYKKAAAEYYKQNGVNSEPPEYLLTMIEFVKKELGQ